MFSLTFKNKKIIASTVSFLLLFVFLLPVLTYAADPLVNCGITSVSSDDKVGGGCDFVDLIDMINRIILWIISIAGVIFAISFIYGGFLYMTSGDNPGNKDKAKGILKSTLYGFLIILTAWVIVYTILITLTDPTNDKTNSIFQFIKE